MQGKIGEPYTVHHKMLNRKWHVHMNLFADNAKLLRQVKKNEEDCKMLQEDLKSVWRWSKKWEMEFSVDKSYYEIGRE